MCYDDLPDGVGVDETAEEDKRHQVIVQDFGIEVKVKWNQCPGDKEWNETNERIAGLVALGAAGSYHIQGPANAPVRDLKVK
jgi:hypothetical protein